MAETTTTGFVPEETAIPSEQDTNPTTPESNSDGFSASEEMELNVSLDQLSYICEYCGKVNAISSPSCVRCGKRRPRSEYVNAMNKLRNANSVKNRYIEEQAKLATDRQEAAQQQLVRLVESRVADEKAQILAQDEIRLEQERDNIKRATARDAVLRIIAAERAADEKVKAAELNAEDALKRRDRAAEEAIAAEREKVLYAAAKRVVSERAGIENAAEERILAERKSSEYKAQDTIDKAVDEAERNAARRAALKIIAGEQAASDRTRLERDAISRAALDRISEERRIAEINAYSKYRIEKEAMQRAVDERINAEREFLNLKRAEVAHQNGQQQNVQMCQQPTTVQPLAIVPYVNSMQPLYQYNTNMRQLYKFVPDEPAAQPTTMAREEKPQQPVREKKDFAIMWLSFFSILLGLFAIAVVLLGARSGFESLKFIQDGPKRLMNADILFGLFKKNQYTVYASGKELSYLAPVGLWALVIGSIVTIIMGIVGVARCKVSKSFFVYALVAFLGAALMFFGLFKIGAFGGEEISNLIDGFKSIGLIVILALTALMLILTSICAARMSKKKVSACATKKKTQAPKKEDVKAEPVPAEQKEEGNASEKVEEKGQKA